MLFCNSPGRPNSEAATADSQVRVFPSERAKSSRDRILSYRDALKQQVGLCVSFGLIPSSIRINSFFIKTQKTLTLMFSLNGCIMEKTIDRATDRSRPNSNLKGWAPNRPIQCRFEVKLTRRINLWSPTNSPQTEEALG